jgi:crotonobetainyl-CoA:carnitine CoA-transferase CaiB-like acyl-CoA transferase
VTAALGGLRVLDFSHALAGPYATLLLADYGATVYKLEAPGGSDMGRGWGPPFIDKGDGMAGQAAFFLGLNRGKLGISIDLKQPAGITLCLRLIDAMDVLIENFRPGTLERLGLGYEAAHARNPRLVYCSISGYGQNGPARDEAAMDLIVQCSSGLVSMTGTAAGEQVRCGYSVADVTAGMFAVIGILLALRVRETTGEGQFIDVSMQDSLISAMTSNYMTYLESGVPPRPLGTSFATVAPYAVFQARDRGFAIAVGSAKLWSSFCRAIGNAGLEHHPDFANNAVRCENRDKLEAILGRVFAERTAAEWLEILRGAGIPCTLVRNFAEVAADQQSEIRGMFPSMDGHRVTGTPVKLSATPGHPGMGAPFPGEHTAGVLRDLLGLDEAAVTELIRSRVISL